MDMTPAAARPPAGRIWAVIAGAALVAAGIFLATAERQAVLAAIAGAAGFALLRSARAERPYSQALVVVDAAAFALFALDRNDGLGFWQLPGPWLDVLRFNLPSAVIALIVYSAAAAMALIAGYRGLRIVEALSLLAVPFLFNVLIVVGADWHMAELGAAVTAHAPLPFPVQVAIGRAITLWLLGEAMLALIVAVSLNRPPRSLRVMGLFALSGAFAAVTPLIANAAQLVTLPLLSIVFSSLCAALAQAGLWAIVYLMTGVALDWLAGRPPRWDAAWDHWRTGVVKGAIYGALFIGFVGIAAFVLRIPGAPEFFSAFALGVGPVLGAALFPLAMTVVGSADGTPPFFGRLRAAYRNPRAPVRGVVVGLGLALAYEADLAAADGGTRFLVLAAIGALCYAGVDYGFDAYAIASGERTKLQGWRLYALGAGLGALVAGALGWYFDSAQLHVVIAKFWAYADVNYRQSGRQLGDFTTYPIFNKYGAVNLGEVAGGVRLFWAESVAGVINWSLAAPLFSINYVLLDALLQRSLRPIKNSPQPGGGRGRGRAGRARAALGPVDGADHQLVPAPVARSELVQSGRRGPHSGRHRRRRLPDAGDVPALQPRPVPGAARLRLAADPDLVRPYGTQGREPRQPVVPRRRPGRRGGGAIRRPQRPDPRHSRRHPPVHDLGAIAHPLLYSAREGVGLRLERRREAFAWRPDARAGTHPWPRLRRRHRALGRRGGRRRCARTQQIRAPGPLARGRAGRACPQSALLRVQQRRGRGRGLSRRARRGLRHGRRAGRGRHRSHPPSARSAAGQRTFLLCRRGGRSALVDRLRARAARR